MSEPRPDPPPINPLDCKHYGRLLIVESQSSPPPDRYGAWVCPRCGQFSVSATKGGVHFRVEFDLPSERLVKAAGRYLEYLMQEDEDGGTPAP